MAEVAPEFKFVTDPTGLTWRWRLGSDDHLALGGHEALMVQLCRNLLPEGGVFVDVGAHVGLYSLRLADKASQVIAIEASASTLDALVENVSLNPQLTEENSDLFRYVNRAVWDDDEKVMWLYDPNHLIDGGSTQVHSPKAALFDNGQHPGECVTERLDSILAETDRVDLIKIDVEGAERQVLDGAHETLRRHQPTLFIEMHDFLKPDNRDEMERRLEGVGYEHGTDIPFGDGYHWICQPKEAT